MLRAAAFYALAAGLLAAGAGCAKHDNEAELVDCAAFELKWFQSGNSTSS